MTTEITGFHRGLCTLGRHPVSLRIPHLKPGYKADVRFFLFSAAEQSGFPGSGFDLASTCDALADPY